jgi:hypothetical protein
MNHTEQRALEAINRLNYDFRQFTVSDFVHHVTRLRRHPIVVSPFPFSAEIHAVWIALGHVDYILYNAAAHPIHQVHSILHECGHLVLNHTGKDLKSLLPPTLLQSARELTAPLQGRLRTIYPADDPQEHEAEAFVRFLQREILVANRLEQLTSRASSIDDLARFARNLGYHD